MIIAKIIDAKGLSCPLPLLKAKQGLHHISSGEMIKVFTTDAGSVRDFHSFITLTEHRMVEFVEHDTYFQYVIQKA